MNPNDLNAHIAPILLTNSLLTFTVIAITVIIPLSIAGTWRFLKKRKDLKSLKELSKEHPDMEILSFDSRGIPVAVKIDGDTVLFADLAKKNYILHTFKKLRERKEAKAS